MPVITSIEDLRRLARHRIPRAVFEYADGGAYDEITLNANTADLRALRLRQRVMVDVSRRSLATRILGLPTSLPLALAPVGLTGLMYRDGEIHAARAAQAEGIPYCLSTMSICSIEDVRAAVKEPFWFQLYVMKDRGFARSLIERARVAQCSALVLTVDLQIQGQRNRDVRNGLAVPPRLTLRNALEMAAKPAWVGSVLMGRRKTFGNLAGRVAGTDQVRTLAKWIGDQFDPSLNWRDIEWVREAWPGKLIVKGVLDAEDARLAVANGADAVVVSNHGGRQLDSAPSTISVLPEVVDAVGHRTEVLFDGGVRSGQDVLKALASGAKAVLVGRAYVYGLAAMGEAGVAKAVDIIRRELDVSMALTGVRTIPDIAPEVLWQRARAGDPAISRFSREPAASC
jgi:L-lactate dehydrogenase (cytochrome)